MTVTRGALKAHLTDDRLHEEDGEGGTKHTHLQSNTHWHICTDYNLKNRKFKYNVKWTPFFFLYALNKK